MPVSRPSCAGCWQGRRHGAVMMTEAAAQFITPVTMQALSNRPVVLSQWDARIQQHGACQPGAREADAIPGRAGQRRSCWRSARAGPQPNADAGMCLARPLERDTAATRARHEPSEMWAHPATQRNITDAMPRWRDRAAGRAGRAGLRRDRRQPQMLRARNSCWPSWSRPSKAAARGTEAAGHGRRPLRGVDPGARHHQPQLGQDGPRSQRRRTRGRRRGHAGGRTLVLPTRWASKRIGLQFSVADGDAV